MRLVLLLVLLHDGTGGDEGWLRCTSKHLPLLRSTLFPPIKSLYFKEVEARGVEPLSEPPLSAASPCSVSSLVSVGGGLRRPTLHPASCLISTVTRSPGHQPSLVVSSGRLPDIACAMSRGLSRESELVRAHIYVFDPVFNEANESSSACSSELRVPVETSTPPFWRN